MAEGRSTVCCGRAALHCTAGLLTVSLLVAGQRARVRRRPGGQLAQAHGAVERLVAQGQRGHGAAAAAGPGSRRLFGASVRPPSASVRHCRASAAFFRRFFSRGRGEAAGQWRLGPPAAGRRPRVSTLIYVPYIKRVFRVPLWIFLGVVCKAGARRRATSPARSRPLAGMSLGSRSPCSAKTCFSRPFISSAAPVFIIFMFGFTRFSDLN